MTFTKTFKQITKTDTGIAGGKGASLGEMTNAKIPVPPGFIVLASAFDRFLEETDLGVEVESIMKRVNHKDINSVDRASSEIRDLIHDVKMPKDIESEILKEFQKLKAQSSNLKTITQKSKLTLRQAQGDIKFKNNFYVAVRSSATAEDSSVASWAGELETYLNVTERGLLESVKKCWSSLFTPRAIFYRFEKKLHKDKVSVAVVVQKMVQSEISGICFTVHPVTKDRDQMVIEAGYGLGEAIVGGKITPDTYVISKKRLAILDKNISEQEIAIVKGAKGTEEISIPKAKWGKQKLSDKGILELARLCAKIEDHYKKPEDIEWAFEKKKFYITQSRPITTL